MIVRQELHDRIKNGEMGDILLMRAYMSSVVFNPAGNKVTLTKFNERFEVGGSNAAMARARTTSGY